MTKTQTGRSARAGARGDRARSSLRPRAGTLVAVAVAGLSAALAWADPFAEPDNGVLLVNNRSGGRRVFPTLVDADPSKATVELQAPDGPVIRIAPKPDGGGHQLLHGDELLGPVTAEDFEGLWSSLRLATAQRTAARGQGISQGVGQRGVIRISLPDQNLTLALGDAVPGGGIYGAFEEDGDTWVIETEMLTLVQQPPRSWLGKRLLTLDVDAVTGLGWADELVLARGDDGFWRVRAGAMPALLSTEAVNFYLRRLLRAPLDPFVERASVASDSLRPHVVVTGVDGSSRALLVGEVCPGYPRKRIVDRGAGLLGCVDAELLERWPVLAADAAMIEAKLVPHEYTRVIGIDLESPARRSLARRGGQWYFRDDESAANGVLDERGVAEEEVRRWFAGLSALEVALFTVPREPGDALQPAPPDTPAGDGDGDGDGQGQGQGEGGGGPPATGPETPALAFTPDWTMTIHADSGDALSISCALGSGPDRTALCVRDDGPILRVLSDPPRNLVFDAVTFAPRDLTALGPGEVTQLEILAPADVEEPQVVRQSVHDDLGQWQLDAPAHVDDNGAIDLVRLENVLWALQRLRAEAWVEPPSDTPVRRIVAEVVPAQGRRYTLRLSLFANCVVEVQGQRPAAISEAQCAALHEDLMFDDPLRFWIERARAFEVSGQSKRALLRRRDDQFVRDDGTPIEDELLAAQLQAWVEWRSQGIRAGDPPGKVEWRIDVRRDFGPPAQVEVGPGWARLEGADWYYEQRPADPEP